ncbi:MAG: intradiol ring-cleavage dioxygenase [Chitinophagales bacterium]
MEKFTEMVLSRLECKDERTRIILTKLIIHLHNFIRDVEPTEEEWFRAINFLTRIGQTCTAKRQEFILLSDVLGVSMLVDSINHNDPGRCTESTVTGPFHAKAEQMEMGSNIARGSEAERGEATLVHGKILDESGKPISNALIDVWQSDDIGNYDVQDPKQPEVNLRGIFKTKEDGKFWLRTIKPAAYPVPIDGPVGELLLASGRHPMRPAHIHFMINAPGYERLITHLFVKGDKYLDSDAVFGVKDSLVLDFKLNDSPAAINASGFKSPFYDVEFDFILKSIN